MKINGREISENQPPYIVAEISANHGGSMDRCISLLAAAKLAGADAVKFQAYSPETLTLDCDKPEFTLSSGPWKGKKIYDIYLHGHTPYAWHREMFRVATELGITLFASVFDSMAVDLLDAHDCAALKIASFELNDIPLIKHVFSKSRPVILSTGMATEAEINQALGVFKGQYRPGIALLHCISGYPTPPEEYDLPRMQRLKQYLHCEVGISDHSVGVEIPIAATVLKAVMIEKHLKLDDMPTLDAAFSLKPLEFKVMADSVRATWKALQPHDRHEAEASSRVLRRSLYAVADIAAGQQFTSQNVRSIRPGLGLPPAFLPQLLGKVAKRSLRRGEPLVLEDATP